MFHSHFAVLLLVVIAAGFSTAYPAFQEEIPNGDRVPNPCDRSKTWDGVGHEDHQGGGPRNKFGLDFYAEGKKWTPTLCRKDSDGDGKTNGEELGDPKCVWTKGATPAITDLNQIQHPGVCEPLNSPSCSATNSFLTECDALGLTTPSPSTWCPAISKPDVKTLTLTLDKAQLTSEETQYVCQQYDLPDDDTYQIIAWQQIIDNRQIAHHMIMYACDNGQDQYLAKSPMLTPTPCRMIPQCGTMVVVWAYGMNGQCYSNDVGAPFGKGHYKTVIVQLHYNNEAQKPGYVDSSGLKFYYTNAIRPKNKGLVAFGEMYLVVPPKTAYYETPGAVLTSDCTKYLFQGSDKFYLNSMLIHIHAQGVFATVTLDKKKAGYKILILNDTFTYDRPKIAYWTAPYEILMEPGDEVTISCGFNTLNKNDWSFFGSQTHDEMCYSFMDVYPRPSGFNFMMPANVGADFDLCARSQMTPNWSARGCDFFHLYARLGLELGVPPENSTTVTEIMNNCVCWGPDNYPAKACSSACYATMVKYNLLKDVCISDDQVWQTGMRPFYDNSEILHRSQSQMSMCQGLKSAPPSGQQCKPLAVDNGEKGGAMQPTASATLVTLGSILLFLGANFW